MTRDDILRMAREAGIGPIYGANDESLERFATLVAAAERERTKRLVEDMQAELYQRRMAGRDT